MRRPRGLRPRLAWAGLTALTTLGAVVLLPACGWLPWFGRTIEMPLAPWPGYEYFYLAQKKGLA